MTAAAADPRRLRTRTDLRFGILVAAVLATGVFAFSAVAVATPRVERISVEVVQPCIDRIEATAAPVPDPVDRSIVQGALANACVRPFIRAEVPWVLGGLFGQALLAAVLYLLHPGWLVRRRRMVRLDGDPKLADVVAELDELAGTAGLRRSPRWYLAPYNKAHGGQAFGLPGRYRVCLDAGLLIRYDLDPDGFRSVIRHELAHLTNRDVGRTYLTVALWWSFVATAMSPFVALTLDSDLLRRPAAPRVTGSPAETMYRLAALLALTVFGYLLRNSILRARELCADTAAAREPAAGPALVRVLEALPWPPRYRRWQVPDRLARLGPHPVPADRAAAISEPDRRAGGSWWEPASLAFMIGLALSNVSLLAGGLFERYVQPGLLVLALPAAVVVVGLLAGAARERRPTRDLVAQAAGVAGGFAVSELLNLMVSANSSLGPLDDGVGPFVASVAVLVAATVLVALWNHSVGRQLRHLAARRLATVTAVVLAAPLIALWFTLTFTSNRFAMPDLTMLPGTGLTIGWYRELARWLNALAFYPPVLMLESTPFVPFALILLWAVPVVLCGRWRHGGAGDRIEVRRAVAAGLIGGLLGLLAAVALPRLAEAALPADVRRTPEGEGLFPFSVEFGLVYVAIAVVLQAGVAAVVAATAARLRPVLVPLAVTVTGVLTVGGFVLTRTMSWCMGLDDAYVPTCVPEFPGPGSRTLTVFSLILLAGGALAIPASLAGAGVGALHRRRLSRRRFGRRLVRQAARWEAAAGLGLLAALVPSAAALAIPGNVNIWMPSPLPAIPASATGPATGDPCLVGTWQVVRLRLKVVLDGKVVNFTGKGQVQTFGADGVVVFDDGAGITKTAKSRGHRYEITDSGSISAAYRTEGAFIRYAGAKTVRARVTVQRIDGVERNRESVVAGTIDDRYTCTGDRLHLEPAEPTASYSYALDLVRKPAG